MSTGEKNGLEKNGLEKNGSETQDQKERGRIMEENREKNAENNTSPAAAEKKEFKLFREKSLEAIESPEALNDYLQVTSPSVWLVLAAVILVLIGAVWWSVFGRIDTSVNVAVVVEGGESSCLVPYNSLEGVMKSGIVSVQGRSYALQPGSDTETLIVSETTNPYVRLAGGLQAGDVAVQIRMEPGNVTDPAVMGAEGAGTGTAPGSAAPAASADSPVPADAGTAALPDGVYTGTVVTESLQPISLLLQ